jgi:hypothetical protein
MTSAPGGLRSMWIRIPWSAGQGIFLSTAYRFSCRQTREICGARWSRRGYSSEIEEEATRWFDEKPRSNHNRHDRRNAMSKETSTDQNVPAVAGENTAGGDGVVGIGRRGVVGESETFQGVFGKSRDNAGIVGESPNFHAVFGISHSANNGGIFGANDAGNGTGFGVIGTCDSNIGVAGDSKTGTGVRGTSQADGVLGIGRRGVVGISDSFQGVFGKSVDNAGVVGESDKFHAVFGISHDVNNAGVIGINDKGGFGIIGVSEQGIGISGKGGRLAGRFEGDVEVTGDIRLTNADCAEDFDVSGTVQVEPGTVMVLGNEGALSKSQQAYDKRVAGVISGAGDYKPGIVLDKQQTSGNRQPIALMGKVYCKVDAQFGAIEVGDLLTTSPTPGHAMKTSDPFKAFGAVIGKALRPLTEGQGLIPILIALQ